MKKFKPVLKLTLLYWNMQISGNLKERKMFSVIIIFFLTIQLNSVLIHAETLDKLKLVQDLLLSEKRIKTVEIVGYMDTGEPYRQTYRSKFY